MMMGEGQRGKEDALWRKLKALPTLFQLDIPQMPETSFSKVITKLRSEKRQVPEEFDEDVRSENLLAFLLLYIDKIEEAKPHIDSVLKKTEDSSNLVALGNICAYYLKQYNVSEAKKYLQTIDMVMKENDQVVEDIKTIAIGEQGYCLSRLGPKCHLMAADKFCKALSRGSPNYQLKIKWNYGLALCLDRLLDRDSFVEDPEFKPAEVYEEAQRCLVLVTGSNIQAFCGKGWVALGEVHSKYVKIHHKYFEGNRKPKGLNTSQIDECFENGLAVAPNDHFVLERVGRRHRHMRRIDDAIECLEKANEVRPSAFSWHHLGLAYRSKAPRGRSSQGSFRGRGRSSQRRPRGNRYRGSSAVDQSQSAPFRGWRGGRRRSGGQYRGRSNVNHGNRNTSHHYVRQEAESSCHWSSHGQWNLNGRNQRGWHSQQGYTNQSQAVSSSSVKGFDTMDGHKDVPYSTRGGRSGQRRPRSRGYRGRQEHFQRYNDDGARTQLGLTDQSLESKPCSDDVDNVQRDFGRMTLDSRDQSEQNAVQTHHHDTFLEKAMHCLERAYELSEGTGVAIPVGLAEIHMQMGQFDEALQYFRKAIDKDSVSRSLEAASCYQKWGECFLQMGQEENGKNMLRKAVESAAKVNVEKRGAFSKLVTLMQKDLGKEDLQADHINELAQLYELVKRYGEALGLRETALRLKADDPTTLCGLVDNLRAQGDYAQARMYLPMLRNLTDVEVPMDVVIEVNLGAAELQIQQDPHLASGIFLETFVSVFPTELHPNLMYNVFVYSDEEDKETAERLTMLCEDQYDLSCRCVHRDIPCTQSVVEMVADLINKSTCIIFVVSKASLQKGMMKLVIGLTVHLVNTRDFGNLVAVNVDDCDLLPVISVYPSIRMEDCFALPGGTTLFRKMISTKSCSH
ncbi:PREDICTED: uncharacterized protein LOC109478276 [Branchiostoma belcheri]|uniref:Uncharacterized protein LOC109478276 n=1 Tax=Branchiostoma belcheri TaxID=7741 RepID=A0A6P4ZEW6_BRABE|nr:PREDICTED: uncharacterized protein LOC109478276 [Branchiostoma belcheri]